MLALFTAPVCASAQDGESDEEGTISEEGVALPEAPALPAPVLDDPSAPSEPIPEPEEEEPEILLHIGPGDHPEWEGQEEVPENAPFVIPEPTVGAGNAVPQSIARAPANSVDPEEPSPLFSITAGAGFARLLAVEAIDYFRAEERFEARIPDIPTLRLGVAATQMVNDSDYILGGGARLGLGAYLFDEGGVRIEGVATVQFGVLAGPLVGPRFDVNGSFDIHFAFDQLVQLSINGGYSMLFDDSLFHLTGHLGFLF